MPKILRISLVTEQSIENESTSTGNVLGKNLAAVDYAFECFRWGNKLVIVASQERRAQTLYGTEVDPGLVMPEKQFALLERIGR